MAVPQVSRVALTLGVVAFLVGVPSMPATGDEASERRFREAFTGPLSMHVSDLLSDDTAKVQAGRAALLAEGTRALPYVRITWESEARPDRRARLAELLGRLVEPGDDLLRRATKPGLPRPGAEEFCLFDLPAYLLLARGLDRHQARAAAARKPLSLVAAGVRFEEGRTRDGLRVLRDLVRKEPGLAADAVSLLNQAGWELRHDTERAVEVGEVIAAAREAAKEAEGEARARILLALAGWHPNGYRAGLDEVIEEAPGTPSSLLAEMRLIGTETGDIWEEIAEYEAFAAEHAGTEAAAQALDTVAGHLSCCNTTKEGTDPIDRLTRLADLALRRAAEGPGSSVDGDIDGFFVSHPKYAPKSLRTFREAYRTFHAHHLLFNELNLHEWSADDLGFLFLKRFGELRQAETGQEVNALDVALEELEVIEARSRWKTHVRFFRAALLAKHGRLEEAAVSLRELAKGEGLHGRKAGATLATVLYARGDWNEAAEQYQAYRESWPDTEYAWFAALRIGHAYTNAKRWEKAAEAYGAAAVSFAGHPVAGPLAHAHTGRVFEEEGRYLDAAEEYEKAVDLWDEAYGAKLHTQLAGIEGRPGPGFDPDTGFEREGLVERAARLRRTQGDAESRALFVRGRRRCQEGDEKEAIALWTVLLEQGMGAELDAEVRGELSDLLLKRALAYLKEGRAIEARENLDLLRRWGGPFSRFAADLARACALLIVDDDEEDATKVLGAALARFSEGQKPEVPQTDLDRRVAGVRAEAFQPHEGQDGSRARSPYVVLRPDLPVILADGTKRQVSFRQELDLPSTEIYLSREEIAWIEKIIDALGGAKRTKPGSVMAIPQPKAQAKRIAALIERFFPVHVGHWGGWHIRTYPMLLELTFLDDDLTRAKVSFRVGYEGGDRLLRFEGGRWKTESVKFTWIE